MSTASDSDQLPLFDADPTALRAPLGQSSVPEVPTPNVSIATHPRLLIELRKGTPRRRRVEGVLHGDTLVVTYPRRLSQSDVLPIAHELRERMERRLSREQIDLVARAKKLAKTYQLPTPRCIAWSDRQQGRWGSCTPIDKSIRISSRLGGYPPWVLDYVIVHELAHLVHGDHGPKFHDLVARYPKAERAIGFLIAKGIDAESDSPEPLEIARD